MKRRHNSSRATSPTASLCSLRYCRRSAARRQHALHQFSDQRVAGARLADRPFETAAADLVEPHAEALQRVANGVLKVEELALEVATMGQKKLQPIRPLGLHIRLAEPAGAHQMRQAKRVGGVGLVALGRHRGAHLAGLETHHRNAERLQLRMQPRRQRPGLVPGALQRGGERRQRLGDRLRLRRNGTLHHDRSLIIDYAQTALRIRRER
jgi:hypothetical protein